MAIYLGIDGGGSKTACAVADETKVLATATAGGSNIVRLGKERARAALRSAVHQACTAAGVPPSSVTRTCIGIAGASVTATGNAVRQIISECVAGEVIIVGDMEIAVEAAFGRAPGVIVVAGTGSIAYGRDADGHTARAGGWGYAISDEGSGDWIGRRAVAGMLRAYDRGQPTALDRAIQQAWHVESREMMVKLANSSPRPDFAALVRYVVVAAKDDEVARAVLVEAGNELAELAAIVAGRLWPDGACVRVALAGGVFRYSAIVRQAFLHAIRERGLAVAINFGIVEPVTGAVAMARAGARV